MPNIANSRNLHQASAQWARRPDDQRFCSIPEFIAANRALKQHSRAVVVSSRKLQVAPKPGHELTHLEISGPNSHPYAPTHHAFGQLSSLVKAPAGYLRTLPAPMAADCLNYGLQHARDVEDVGVLITAGVEGDEYYQENTLRAATGPNYGRVWNLEIGQMLFERFGDGVRGPWKVPGEFGKDVPITKANTTIYGSDRDCFIFLADEQRRIELPDRRAGRSGSFARGFFTFNSEVGDRSLGIAFFLFDYVCCNRIVWGATEYQKVTLRHTSGAPDRWLSECVPVLSEFAEGSAKPVLQAIEDARAKRIDDVKEFLAKRFTKALAEKAMAIHQDEEGRPIETQWDAVTALTAVARHIPHQDARVALEQDAGKLLN